MRDALVRFARRSGVAAVPVGLRDANQRVTNKNQREDDGTTG
jgi:hypothetical protein